MADNYCQTSCWLDIPRDKITDAETIIRRCQQELWDQDDYVGVEARLEFDDQRCGIWFHDDESVNPEHMHVIALALMQELRLTQPFIASWAYTCSRPRIDEFGGGGFAIRPADSKGRCRTKWIDAQNALERWAERNTKVKTK